MIYLIFNLGFSEMIAIILIFAIMIALLGALIYGVIKLYHHFNDKNDKSK